MSVTHDLIVSPQGRPLFGSVPLLADERIGPIAVLCAALADGRSELVGSFFGESVLAMIEALRRFDVRVEVEAGRLRVFGVSLGGLSAPSGPVYCGAEPSIMQLLAGVLVAQSFASELVGGPALMALGMQRLAQPLRFRGGQIEGLFSATTPGEITPPLTVGPLAARTAIIELEHELDPTGPDLKAPLLLSGLFADGATYLREPFVTADHAERLLQALDVPVAMLGSLVELDPGNWNRRLPGLAGRIPGDASAALVVLAAAALVPGSRVCARDTGLNPTRTGALQLLAQMGSQVESEIHEHGLGEPSGIACASYAPLHATAIGGELGARASDDRAVLAALAARAEGTSVVTCPRAFGDEGAWLVSLLRAFGAEAELSAQGLVVQGVPSGSLAAADVDAHDQADLGAAGVLLGLLGEGPTRVRRIDGFGRRFRRMVGTLRALGADLRVEPGIG